MASSCSTVFGQSGQMDRRVALRAGMAGVLGLSLPELLAARASAGRQATAAKMFW